MDVLSVSACVQAVISAFYDAADLVRRIKENQDCISGHEDWNEQINDLESSLDLGPPIVKGQYDSDFRKFGETYGRGDNIVREQLKDVLITLQMAVLSNLTGVWTGSRAFDHSALQVASEDGRVNAVLCLIQWQQRLLSATTAQLEKSTQYPLDDHSPPMTPPLTNVSSQYEPTSSIDASGPATPFELSHQLSYLSIVPTSSQSQHPSPASSAKPLAHESDEVPPVDDLDPIEFPCPLFAHSKSSVNQQEPIKSSQVVQPIPVRSPRRPIITIPRDSSSERPMAEPLAQAVLPSPVSPINAENEHFQEKSRGRLGRPDDPDSPVSSMTRPSGQSEPEDVSQLHPVRSRQDSPTLPESSWYSPVLSSPRSLPSLPSPPSTTTPLRGNSSPVSPLEPSDIHPAFRNESPKLEDDWSGLTASAILSRSSLPPSPTAIDTLKPLPCRPPFPPPSAHSSMIAQRRESTSTIAPFFTPPGLILPTEANSYLGFCSSAYKLQIELPTDEAFSVATFPTGLYTTYQVWRCSKCPFEGPVSYASTESDPDKVAGTREVTFHPLVRRSEGGIAYRWAFLAKSHISSTSPPCTKRSADRCSDSSPGPFRCVFCCTEGLSRGWLDRPFDPEPLSALSPKGTPKTKRIRRRRGALTSRAGRIARRRTDGGNLNHTCGMPIYDTAAALMRHLEMHRTPEGLPSVEMQNWMNCVVGRIAQESEDFDINLPPPREEW